MKKTMSFILSIIIVCTISLAIADDNSSWGFGNLQMPDMPDMSQSDWWGSFETPEGWGSFDFGNFNSPVTGEWGNTGVDGTFGDMSSAFEEFKNNTLNGLNKESSLPSNNDANSTLQDAFNSKKDEITNGGNQSSSGVQDLFSSVFGDDKKYTPVEQQSLPITFDQIMASNTNLESMNTSIADQIKSIASTSRITGLIQSAQSDIKSASFDNLPDLSIGESGEDHVGSQFGNGSAESKYEQYKNGLKINIEEASSDMYKGLYNAQKNSLK